MARSRMLLTLLLLCAFSSAVYCYVVPARQRKLATSFNENMQRQRFPSMSKDSDGISRRRRRRGISKEDANQAPSSEVALEPINEKSEPVLSQKQATSPSTQSEVSMEEMFGLGDNQLRELMETELPVPREDLITRKAVEKVDKEKVFQLPDLNEFMTDSKANENEEPEVVQKIDRRNFEQYSRAMQLNPFADSDESLFIQEYDIIPSIFGTGKLLGIEVPYLQTGHGILLIVTLLSAFVYAPGNPLTEFPTEIREFLRQGLIVVYSVNLVLAIQSFFQAKKKNLPAVFWAVKSLIFGGVAYYELTQAEDPIEKRKNEYAGVSAKEMKMQRRKERREKENK